MTGKQMSVEALVDTEQALATSIVHATAEAGGVLPGPEAEADLENLPDSFRGRGGEFWLVKAKGAAIGTVGVRPASTGAAEWTLEYLCVQPAWRGMGIGRMLAERAVDFARLHGADRVLARCPPNAGSMRALLAGLGFQEVSVPSGGKEETGILMRRIFV